MTPVTHILVAIDFGETTKEILDVAVAMAAKFDAKLTVAHAFYTYPFAATDGLRISPDIALREARAELETVLTETRRRYAHVEGTLTRGEPSEEILRLARARAAHLIVVGTHGRKWFSHLFLGSVAETIVRRSPVPVVTVSASADTLDIVRPKDLRSNLPGTRE